jgi:flagellar hook-basal body complex protein FliE
MIVSSVSQALAAAPAKAGAASDGAASFAGLLEGLGLKTIQSLNAAEQTGAAALEGKASVQQAVFATLEAEQALQAAIAIRDKIVGAINEVTRMQI